MEDVGTDGEIKSRCIPVFDYLVNSAQKPRDRLPAKGIHSHLIGHPAGGIVCGIILTAKRRGIPNTSIYTAPPHPSSIFSIPFLHLPSTRPPSPPYLPSRLKVPTRMNLGHTNGSSCWFLAGFFSFFRKNKINNFGYNARYSPHTPALPGLISLPVFSLTSF